MVHRDSRVPLHMQLADSIRDQIRRQELRPNDRLPSERDLCRVYNISRITVRKAVSTLVQEGLVCSSIGKGTYVAETALHEALQPLNSFSEDLSRRGMSSTNQVLDAQIVPADDPLAIRMQIMPGAEVVSLSRLRLANGLPIAIQYAYLPHYLCPNLLRFDFARRSLYDVLRSEYRLRLARSDTTIEAALAQPKEAGLLQVKRPAAVLISEQITCLDTGPVIEITRSYFHAERYKLFTRT